MHKIIILLLLVSFRLTIFSMIDPYYKEVLERGYKLMPGDSVLFPDGSACKIKEFNSGVCGQEWMTTDYCVEEGEAIWNEDRCCEGLEAGIANDTDGQATCESTSSWFGNGTLLYFFLGVLIPLGLFVILAFGVKRKMKQRNVRN